MLETIIKASPVRRYVMIEFFSVNVACGEELIVELVKDVKAMAGIRKRAIELIAKCRAAQSGDLKISELYQSCHGHYRICIDFAESIPMYQVNGAGETWAKALGVALVKDFDERDGGGVMSDDKTQQPFQITTDEDKRYAFKKLLSGTEPLAYGEEPANCPANSPGKLDGSNELEQLRAELAAVKGERDALAREAAAWRFASEHEAQLFRYDDVVAVNCVMWPGGFEIEEGGQDHLEAIEKVMRVMAAKKAVETK